MTAKTKKQKTTKERFEKIFYNNIEFGIITSLKIHSSLNLKRIAKLIDKPESTTIRYLKKLLEEGLIIIDTEETAQKWGKFYCLSDEIEKLYENHMKEAKNRNKGVLEEIVEYKDKSEEELKEFLLEKALEKKRHTDDAILTQNNLTLVNNFEKCIINDVFRVLQKIEEIKEEKGKEYLEEKWILEPIDVILLNRWIKYSKFSHLVKFYLEFLNFHQKITKLQEEIQQEMEEEGIPEKEQKTLFVDLFMGTIEMELKFKDEK
jgi:predicted transcriptional regulator